MREAVPDVPETAPPPAPAAVTFARRVSVVIEGEFRTPLSLAHINRELGLALARDPNIAFTGVEHAPVPDPAIELAPELAACMRPAEAAGDLRPDVRITLHWPPFLERRPAGRYVTILPWELSELPLAWRDAIERGIDEVWVISQHSYRAFARAGIAPAKLAVLPLGIDPALFRADGARLELAARSFRFLYVGGTVGRKGFDFVERAYFRTYGPADDVTLVVKDVGTGSVYKADNAGAYLRKLATSAAAAHMLYTDETFGAAAMAQLYRSCDALVAPYRAEGFGLPILEAMACGLPVIVPAGGASDDFADDGCAIRIPAARVPSPRNVGLELVRDAWVLEPDLTALEQAMLRLAGDPALRARLGAAAAERAADWTWERTAAFARAAIARMMA
jgi:glycosyltransferase involved in cell wall biosynthesis